MKTPNDRPDGMSPILEFDLDELLADVTRGRPGVDEPARGWGPLVGEVLDTHHPHRPGRILVRWDLDSGDSREA